MSYRVTVIMGLYNCADTLEEALNSLLAQTYQNFCVIMCDDGSTDETFLVAEKFRTQYPNYFLIKNDENKGLNYTLNKCLGLADSEVIARMDADDVSLPTRFEEQINILDTHPDLSIVGTAMIHFDEGGNFRTSQLKEFPLASDFVRGTPFCHATCMVRREAFLAVKGYSVGPALLRVEDYHLWFKMYQSGFKGMNILKPLYKMRDDRNAFLRRKFKYRINEARVIYSGVQKLKLPFLSRFYALRPILIGLLPISVYRKLRSLKDT